MIKTNLYVIGLSILLLTSCSNNKEHAIEYNEKIVLSYQKVAGIEEKLMFYMISGDTTNFKSEHEKFINQIETSEKEINELGSFMDYSDFKEAALNMMKAYKEIANKKILDLLLMIKVDKKEADTLEHNNSFEYKLHELDSVMEIEFVKFETAQQKFATKYNFTLM